MVPSLVIVLLAFISINLSNGMVLHAVTTVTFVYVFSIIKSYLTFLLSLLFLVRSQSLMDVDEPYQLKRYKNAGDIYFIKFQIPENSDVAVFSFTLLSKLPDCPIENATV